MCVASAEVTDRVKRDRYLAVHVRYYCREMRIKAYAQLLDSYRSVRLDSMAKAFGVTEEFLDRCDHLAARVVRAAAVARLTGVAACS